jgi:hypothetical protein
MTRTAPTPGGFVHIAPKATATIEFGRWIVEFLRRYLAPAAVRSS